MSISASFNTIGHSIYVDVGFNIAAASMMIAALHPITGKLPLTDKFRLALLMAITIGANFGGIATPIGTGLMPSPFRL